jgi:hypothetical protein
MPMKNEHSIRIKSPDYPKYARKTLTSGVDAVLGIKNGKSEVQALRFDKDKFTMAQAVKWANEHGYDKHLEEVPAKDHLDAGSVAVRGAVQDVSLAYQPGVGTNPAVPKMPVSKVKDSRSDMSADVPGLKEVKTKSPAPDSQSPKYGPNESVTSDLSMQAIPTDQNHVPMDSVVSKADPKSSTVGESGYVYRIPPLMYAEPNEDRQSPQAQLKDYLLRMFAAGKITSDNVITSIATRLNMPEPEVENQVYEVLTNLMTGGASEGKTPAGVNPVELSRGIRTELEHTSDIAVCIKIALDHLTDDKEYYSKLYKAMGYSDFSEIEMAIDHRIKEEPAVGLGNLEDRLATTVPLKQDGTSENLQSRDAPVYKEEPDEDDMGLEIPDEDDGDEDGSGMWVEAFKAGQHTDSEGNTRTWAPDDINKIAQQYNSSADAGNPNRKMAPVVLGHPKDDAPAYGWIDKVKAVSGTLKAHLTELNTSFVDALKSGAYKTRSLSLYPDLSIRHIGFLGGVQPAVPGLGPFKFAENDHSITIEFNEGDDMAAEDVKALKSENNFFKRLFSLFKVDVQDFREPMPGNTPDENNIQTRVPEARSAVAPDDKKGETSTMAEPTKILEVGDKEIAAPAESVKEEKDELTTVREELAKLKEVVQTLEREKAAAEAELGSKEVRERTQDHMSFCESLVAEGRLAPVDVKQTVLNLELRYKADSETLDFAEQKTTPATDEYKDYLKSRPVTMCFEEIAKPATASNLSSGSSSDKVMKYCEDYMKANPGMSYSAAMEKCGEEHKDEMQDYLSNI